MTPNRIAHQRALDLKVSEDDFLRAVVELASLCGWLVFHPRPAMVREGKFVTATMGHIGYPDLTLVHERRKLMVFAELKTSIGRLTVQQKAWGAALLAAGVDYRLWRPVDMVNEIVPLLRG